MSFKYGYSGQVAVGADPEFSWNEKDGELVVETTGSVKLQRYVRTKFVDIPDTTLTADGSLIFETTGDRLKVVVTGATSEVVVRPFERR